MLNIISMSLGRSMSTAATGGDFETPPFRHPGGIYILQFIVMSESVGCFRWKLQCIEIREMCSGISHVIQTVSLRIWVQHRVRYRYKGRWVTTCVIGLYKVLLKFTEVCNGFWLRWMHGGDTWHGNALPKRQIACFRAVYAKRVCEIWSPGIHYFGVLLRGNDQPTSSWWLQME